MLFNTIFALVAFLASFICAQPSLIPGSVVAPGAPTAPAPVDPNLPVPANQNPPISTPVVAAYSGSGSWLFDFDYLGCQDGTANCATPIWSRYSPATQPAYVVGNGKQMEVRLWWKMVNTNFDLYVERWNGQEWVTLNLNTQRPNGWQEKIVFTAANGNYYRFRALRRTGAGYYVLSWKFS